MKHLQKAFRSVQLEDGGKVVNFHNGFESWEEIVESMRKIGIDIEHKETANG